MHVLLIPCSMALIKESRYVGADRIRWLLGLRVPGDSTHPIQYYTTLPFYTLYISTTLRSCQVPIGTSFEVSEINQQ